MPEPTWEHAIAAVIDGEGVTRGTAFFVGSDVALTCDHVLSAASKQPVSLKPVGGSTSELIIETDRDEDLDLALIRVAARPDRKWLALSSREEVAGHNIRSRGFPRNHPSSKYPDGFPMDPARVSGETTLNWQGQLVPMLVLDAGVEKGMSGAPAVDADTDAVIGVLRFRDGEDHALAIPTNTAMRRWPRLPTTLEQPARSFSNLTPAIPAALAKTAWKDFDPARLHCVVVNSEVLAKGESEGSLGSLVTEVLSSPKAKELWKSFISTWQGRELLARGQRHLSAEYSKANVELASFDVVDAYASPASLDRVVQLIVQADLALFDVTGFEPGVMLLLGIRAATRRGITINSHGGDWYEGHPIDRPFNLSDLSLSSHTPPPEMFAGDDPRIDRFIDRICTGFAQLVRQPHYLDLPVYDSLRLLGSQDNAWASVPLEDQVLVLCSYDKTYFPTWRSLRGKLREALSLEDILTDVERLQDMATPQLVSQSLYERIRRCAGCVADWTGSSPSTFFELGVRLAVSPWSVVQIADERWLEKITHGTDPEVLPAKQIENMKALLNPLTYSGTNDNDIGSRIARQLIQVRERIRGSKGHRVRQVAAEALRATEERLPQLFEQLMTEADGLDYKDRERGNVPQALFYEIQEISEDQQKSALERRLAAWFYLDLRVGADRLGDSDERKRTWQELGKLVASDLYLSDDEADLTLADEIMRKLT
jgi:Trypsin-like peptidase domain